MTQGCRLNQSETASLEQASLQRDYTIVPMSDNPDVVVINTCTVTENGDADTRKLVRKINREAQDAKIALIGCQSQILKEKLLELENVQWVIGNDNKMNLNDILTTHSGKEQHVLVEKIKREPFTIPESSVDRSHTRANIKIQDGCDFYCSFCVIPFARGPARSRVFEDIHREVVDLVSAGHKEVVITGINVGTYEHEGRKIVDVIESLSKIKGLARIRISSIEPTTIPEALFDMMNDDSHPLCKYLHIPLQSGSEFILSEMARKYTIKEFRTFIETAREKVKDICIGTDVIVGFPGETKAHFDETVANLMTMPIDYYHVFSYSDRELARAKKRENPVPPEEIKRRSAVLRALSKKQKEAYTKRFLDRTVSVLFEQEKKGYWTGLTEHYLRVYVESDKDLSNKILTTQCTRLKDQGLFATII